MHYKLSISSPIAEAFEILVAELSEIGFDGFVEEEGKLEAFVPEDLYNAERIEDILNQYQEAFSLEWTVEQVQNENWNALWESNFEPVRIADKLFIRALFHEPEPSYPLEIVIHPQMSFGTGHHATTSMICEYLLETDLKDKQVFDFGTGTGILAILAKMLGAQEVWAIDNDPICVDNTLENIGLNSTEKVHVALGDIRTAFAGSPAYYDLVIGNITRNVILEYLSDISNKLMPGSVFLASGFYESDLDMLKSAAYSLGLQIESYKIKDGWCAASFRKL